MAPSKFLWADGFGRAVNLRPESRTAIATSGGEDAQAALAGLLHLVAIVRDEGTKAKEVDGTAVRVDSTGWPLPGTQWRPHYLDVSRNMLGGEPAASDSQWSYDAEGDGLSVETEAMDGDTTLVGPISGEAMIRTAELRAG